MSCHVYAVYIYILICIASIWTTNPRSGSESRRGGFVIEADSIPIFGSSEPENVVTYGLMGMNPIEVQ